MIKLRKITKAQAIKRWENDEEVILISGCNPDTPTGEEIIPTSVEDIENWDGDFGFEEEDKNEWYGTRK